MPAIAYFILAQFARLVESILCLAMSLI